MVNWKSRKLGDFLWIANAIAIVILVNLLASYYFFRVDLTEEKRYTIKDQTKELLRSLEEDVYIEVFLAGELNAGFRRLQKNIDETLAEFRVYSGNKVQFVFTDPAIAIGQKARNEFMQDLAAKGIQPTNVVDKQNGQRVEKIIFPGAVVSYGGFESGVMLLKGNKAATSEEVINQSIEGIEFELANAIQKLVSNDRKRIGFIQGHGELDSLSIAGLNNDLIANYDVFKVNLSNRADLKEFDLLMVMKPTTRFSPLEKLRLDQYIMNGGKVIFLVDKLDATMESASGEENLAVPYNHDLDDLLFKYGVRINLNLLQDQNCGLYPVITGEVAGKPQVQLLEWPFFPLINNYATHPITRNLDAIVTKFVSSIDTVKAPGIKKTGILFTSNASRAVGSPVNISINQLRNAAPTDFNLQRIPVAYLLEGKFSSLFKNRFLPEGADSLNYQSDGVSTKLLVVADGDIGRNEINPRTRQPQALGFDPFTNYTFANRDFLLNAIAYLTDENGLIQTRSKQVKIRPLDKEKIKNEKLKWQIVNIAVPLLLLIGYGIIRSIVRKRKYARF
jgi:ABC-2 type transport system permease protein